MRLYLLAISLCLICQAQASVTVLATNRTASGYWVRAYPSMETGYIYPDTLNNYTFTNCEALGIWPFDLSGPATPWRSVEQGKVYVLDVTGEYGSTAIYDIKIKPELVDVRIFWGGFGAALGMGLFRYIVRLSKKVATDATG